MILEYGVREFTPWDRKGVIVARYALKSDAKDFVVKEREIQKRRNVDPGQWLTYKIVHFRKAFICTHEPV